MKNSRKISIILVVYTILCIAYIAFAHGSDFWSLFYYSKDNLLICVLALLLRPYIKFKVIPDFVILIKAFSTLSITLRLYFNCRLLQDYSAMFLLVVSIPLIIYEWRQITQDK